MLLEAIDRPFKFLFSDGTQVRLTPGQPVELSKDRARRLLDRAKGKVRVISCLDQRDGGTNPRPDPPVIGEPHPNPRPCYWEARDGTIRRGLVTMLGRYGSEFWVLIEEGPHWVWTRDYNLRSKAQWEAGGAQRKEQTRNQPQRTAMDSRSAEPPHVEARSPDRRRE